MTPARSFPPMSGNPAPCAVRSSRGLCCGLCTPFFCKLRFALCIPKKGHATTHAKRPRRGRGRREARRLWDSRLRAGQPQREGSRNPRCRLAHLRRAERNPRPRRGQRTNPHPTTAPTAAPRPPAHQTQHSRVPHWGPGGRQNGRGKTPPPAQGRRSRRAPPPGGNLNNGLDAQAHGTGAPRDAHTPPTREGPNTSPHHSGLATEAPAASRPARKGPERPTNPTRGGWARRGRDRPCPENPPLRRAGPPPEG